MSSVNNALVNSMIKQAIKDSKDSKDFKDFKDNECTKLFDTLQGIGEKCMHTYQFEAYSLLAKKALSYQHSSSTTVST